MHPKDEMLRAYLDRELSAGLSSQVKEHLARCPKCTENLMRLKARASKVYNSLDALPPTTGEFSSSPQSRYKQLISRNKETTSMFAKRPIWAILGVVIILAVALSLTPVRAWASSFLGLFRVQQVQVIPFDPSAIENAQDRIEGSQDFAREFLKENVEFSESGEAQRVASADEAAALAGYTPRLPNVQLANGATELWVKPGMVAEFTIDQPAMQELIDIAGLDIQLPKSVDGKEVTVDVGNAVVSVFGDCIVEDTQQMHEAALEHCTAMLQMPSPTVNTPDELNKAELGEAMLQFLGFSEEEARNYSTRIDWATTLLIPVPQGEGITYQEVSVDGVSGTMFTEEDNDEYTLLWVKGDFIYAIHGTGGYDEALAIIKSLP